MGTNRLPDETEFICDDCNEIHLLEERCLDHWNGEDWVSRGCCEHCRDEIRNWVDDDMNPPDEGRGSIYVDPEGLR